MRDKEGVEGDMTPAVKSQSGVGERGLGMEIRHFRMLAGLSLEYVAGPLDWSVSKLSRFERGLRPGTTAEEVSCMLGVIRVTGDDRIRIMKIASGQQDQVFAEGHDADVSDQARIFMTFEREASKITSVEPLLVPGILQTYEYSRALLVGFNVEESKINGRLARRLGRQQILERSDAPEMVFIISEWVLRQPVASRMLMAQQVRRIAAEAMRPRVTVLVVPMAVLVHPGLDGAFMVLEFVDDPPVAFIEGRMSGMFPENPAEVAEYKMAAERQADLALDEQGSLELLHTIAEDLERAR